MKDITPKLTFDDKIRFTPYAYSKLLFIRDCGKTEVAGYGITETDDPLLVTNFVLIKQKCTSVTFDLDPLDILEFTDRMLDAGLPPWAFSNILIHTHPGNCSQPSGTDEDNFKSAFSHPHWAIMLIVAKGGETYCRIKTNVGPGVEKILDVVVDCKTQFSGTDREKWKEEYESKVTEEKLLMTGAEENIYPDDPLWKRDFDQWIEEQVGFDELDCEWDKDGDVLFWDNANVIWYSYSPDNGLWQRATDSGSYEAIPTPKEPFAAKVVEWANKHIEERLLTTDENNERTNYDCES